MSYVMTCEKHKVSWCSTGGADTDSVCPWCQMDAIERDGTTEHNAAVALRQKLAQAKQELERSMCETTTLRSGIVDILGIPYDTVIPDDTELLSEVRRLYDLYEHAMKERAALLLVKSKDGLLSSEWILRTAMAEKSRDETEEMYQKLLNAIYAHRKTPEEQARAISPADWVATRLIHVSELNDLKTQIDRVASRLHDLRIRSWESFHRILTICGDKLAKSTQSKDWAGVEEVIEHLKSEVTLGPKPTEEEA